MDTCEILIFQNQEGSIKIDIWLKDETVWLTQVQMEELFGETRSAIKGFALKDDSFKSGNSMNYFVELQGRIRQIRLSERFFLLLY